MRSNFLRKSQADADQPSELNVLELGNNNTIKTQ